MYPILYPTTTTADVTVNNYRVKSRLNANLRIKLINTFISYKMFNSKFTREQYNAVIPFQKSSFTVNCLIFANHYQTRQSEMENTLPATFQCLATFTPLQNLIFFRDVISLLARVFIF